MSRFGISLKSPSFRGAFFLLVLLCAVVSIGAWTNVHETEERKDMEMLGTVNVIQPNYISIVYNNSLDGVNQEVGFVRLGNVELKHRARWEDIRVGEKVIFRFVQIAGIREGRSEVGEFRQESYVKDRQLRQLEFEKPTAGKPLVSG